jgi:hypothetical protein
LPVAKKPAKRAPVRKKATVTWKHSLAVVGLRFRFKKDGRRAFSDMIDKRGSIGGMRLIREPDNKYDANAIMVCLPERVMDGKQIGYIRATSAELLAPKLDAGTLEVRSAKLLWLDPDTDWNEGELEVYFADIPAKGKTAK